MLIKYPVIRSGAAPAFSIPDFKMRLGAASS